MNLVERLVLPGCATFVCACTSLSASLVAHKAAADQYGIESYCGRYVEQYEVSAPQEVGANGSVARVIREVRYLKPGKVRLEVIEPPERVGELLVYDGSTMAMWWPADRFGVRIKNAMVPSEAIYQAMIAKDTAWWWDHFGFDYVGTATVAGHNTRRWKASPTRRGPLGLPYDSWVEINHSMPMKTVIRDRPTHDWYTGAFDKVEFGCKIDPKAVELAFPEDAVVVEWDLAEPGVSVDKLQERMNFELVVPKKLPKGLSLHSALVGRSGVPVAVLLFSDGLHWLSLTETRHLGRSLKLPPGIPFQIGNETASLNLLGGFTAISWYSGSRLMTLIGNMPYPAMAGFATEIGAQAPAPDEDVTLATVNGYRGRLLDRHAGAKTEIVREVLFAKPDKVEVRLLEPKIRKGELFMYDGTTFVMWWPQHLLGVRIRGVEPVSEEDLREAARSSASWTSRNYRVEYHGTEEKAQRQADRFQFTPTRESPGLLPYDVWMDRATSLPLSLEVRDAAGSLFYTSELAELALNEPAPEGAFSFTFPANAVVFEWDLSDPGKPLAELQKRMNFEILLPHELPEGLEVRKLVRGKHSLPMVVVLMNSGGRWLTLTETRNLGPVQPTDVGAPVKVGKATGTLNLMGGFTSILWSSGNTSLTLVGNLPFPQMIDIASSVR